VELDLHISIESEFSLRHNQARLSVVRIQKTLIRVLPLLVLFDLDGLKSESGISN